jgi:hypothetical protein
MAAFLKLKWRHFLSYKMAVSLNMADTARSLNVLNTAESVRSLNFKMGNF